MKAAKVETAAGSKLDTKTLDFSSVVNTGDLENSAFNVDSNLKLTRGESGDVRLEANTFGGKEASVTHAGSIDAQGDVFLSAKSTGFNNYHTDEEVKQPYINDTTDISGSFHIALYQRTNMISA